MAGYTKLFSDIVDSSIWDEDAETCKVWVTLLALSDASGYVRGSAGWLAGKAKVSVQHCEFSLNKFKNPDPRSRTPDNDGRRIEQLEDGWLILNYISFRERLSSDPKAAATRARVQKHREQQALRNKKSVTTESPASASASVPNQDGSEFDLYIPQVLNIEEFKPVWHQWVLCRKKKKQCKDWFALFEKQLEWLTKFTVPQVVEILNTSMRNDWQGLFEPNATNQGRSTPRVDRNATTLNNKSQYDSRAAEKSQHKASNLPGV